MAERRKFPVKPPVRPKGRPKGRPAGRPAGKPTGAPTGRSFSPFGAPYNSGAQGETRSVLLAVVISVTILLGFDLLYIAPQRQAEQARLAQLADEQAAGGETFAAPTIPSLQSAAGDSAPASGQASALAAPILSQESRQVAVESGDRVVLDGGGLAGSLSLTGALLDDVALKGYNETIAPESPAVRLLRPPTGAAPFFARFGWAAPAGVAVPDATSRWQVVETSGTDSGGTDSGGTDSSDTDLSGGLLSGDAPLVLRWDNGAGLIFFQEWRLEDRYLFSVAQRVVNQTGRAVTLAPLALLARIDPPPGLGYFILHEGPLGWLDESLQEPDYQDLLETPLQYQDARGGWFGFTDKYWMAALLPAASESAPVAARFLSGAVGSRTRYQADTLREAQQVPVGATATSRHRLFAGAKEVRLLDDYKERLAIANFDLAVDFGWMYFLTKPLFSALDGLFRLIGNFGLAILALTVFVRLLFFPLANRSFRTMAKMRKIQPQMLELRERLGDDKPRLQKEMMELYKREQINVLSGCLPILLQIPVFFALYKVLFVTIEMRHTPFYGWIADLSAADPTSWINAFGILPWGVPDLGAFNVIHIGVWPVLMGLTMAVQTRLNPPPPDPVQARIFAWMPVFFTFFLAAFPAGLVIYWTWNNVLSILQQMVIMRRAGVEVRLHFGAKKSARDEATDRATDKATDEATDKETDKATGEATGKATKDKQGNGTEAQEKSGEEVREESGKESV